MNRILKWLETYLEDIIFLMGLILISIAAFIIGWFVWLVVTGGELIITALIIAKSKRPLSLRNKQEEVSD